MSELLKDIDGRTRLAGTNKLEILLFTLGVDAVSGRNETFGINVFKVREVMRTPAITRAPEMPPAVEVGGARAHRRTRVQCRQTGLRGSADRAHRCRNARIA